MPDIPELHELRRGLNDSYLDQWGNTIWSPTRPGQLATLHEIAEMRIAQIVGPPKKQDAGPKPAVAGKPTLTRAQLKAMDPFKAREAVLGGKYQLVD